MTSGSVPDGRNWDLTGIVQSFRAVAALHHDVLASPLAYAVQVAARVQA
jgi:hypothetical protein